MVKREALNRIQLFFGYTKAVTLHSVGRGIKLQPCQRRIYVIHQAENAFAENAYHNLHSFSHNGNDKTAR